MNSSNEYRFLAEDRAAQAEATAALVQSTAACIHPWKRTHPYALAHRLEKAAGQVFNGDHKIAGVDCTGAAAIVIYDTDSNAANVLCCVRGADGVFEDVLIPGAKLAGCFGRVGNLTETILLAEDYTSSLALHLASGYCVAFCLYAANIGSVCTALRAKYPKNTLIVCLANTRPGFDGADYSDVIAAAREASATVAFPPAGMTFIGQHMEGGPNDVWRCIEAATEAGKVIIPQTVNANPKAPIQRQLWPTPVSGSALLQDIVTTLRRHVVLPRNAILTIALWIMFTYAHALFLVAPYLFLTSPVRQCGKTTLLGLMKILVNRALLAASVTPAVLYRAIDAYQPTFIIDEFDNKTTLASDDMRTILNAGHRRDTANIMRTGKNGKPEHFNAFCPKLLAGIGLPADTILDRCVLISHQRKLEEEVVDELDDDARNNLEALAMRVARWTPDNLQSIKAARFNMPDLGDDRAKDNWRPLLAIAHCAGGLWFERAVQAAVELSHAKAEALCGPEELLRDIKEAFDTARVDRITSAQLLQFLCADPEKPWATYRSGRPINRREIVGLLVPFGIKTKNVRFGQQSPKGFERDQFADAFARYLPQSDR